MRGSPGSVGPTFAPGGSRIEVVLGVAMDPAEEAIAAICGADRQRFILLVKKGGPSRFNTTSTWRAIIGNP
jgi:hypothetical protein